MSARQAERERAAAAIKARASGARDAHTGREPRDVGGPGRASNVRRPTCRAARAELATRTTGREHQTVSAAQAELERAERRLQRCAQTRDARSRPRPGGVGDAGRASNVRRRNQSGAGRSAAAHGQSRSASSGACSGARPPSQNSQAVRAQISALTSARSGDVGTLTERQRAAAEMKRAPRAVTPRTRRRRIARPRRPGTDPSAGRFDGRASTPRRRPPRRSRELASILPGPPSGVLEAVRDDQSPSLSEALAAAVAVPPSNLLAWRSSSSRDRAAGGRLMVWPRQSGPFSWTATKTGFSPTRCAAARSIVDG